MKRGGAHRSRAGFTISDIRQQWCIQFAGKRQPTGSAGPGWSQSGFTIVETMIVLAVTGAMFVSVALLIGGRQAKTQFQQGINEVVSQLQQVAREVSIGYYPNANIISCTPGGSGPIYATTASTQGANQGCIFLGKVLYFNLATPGGNTNNQYKAFVLGGCQMANCAGGTSGSVATSLAQTLPRAIEKGSVAPTTTFPSATATYTLNGGIYPLSVTYYDAGGSHQTQAFAFLQTLGTYAGCSGLCSGSQQASLYGVVDAPPYASQSQPDVVNLIDQASNLVPAQKVVICLRSGTTNQVGELTISGNTSAVTLAISNGATCP